MKKRYAVALIALLIFLAGTIAYAESGAQARFSVDLTPIVQAVISLLAMLITAKVIPWLKAKTTDAQQQALTGAARIAVLAAEQIYKGSGRGDEKMAYAQKWLMDHGYALDVVTIEAAVREMNLPQGWAVATAVDVEPPHNPA